MGNPLSRVITLARASIPIAYVRLGLDVAAARGLSRDTLLRGLSIELSALDCTDARVPLSTCARLIARVWRATGDASLGYEFGLRSSLAAHGSLGYGLMSQTTVGQALEFGLKYGRLRNPVLRLSLRIEGDHAVVDTREALPLGPMRQYAIDAVLVSMTRIGRQISGTFKPQMELRFDCDRPAHFERYRHRLPPTIFNAGVNQLRFPAEYLQRPLATGDAISAQGLADQCERELALIGDVATVAERVRAMLSRRPGGYPKLAAVATGLHMSERTLKRKLQQEDLSFLHLLDEARQRDGQRLLATTAMDVKDVAGQLGYNDPASFTRAFRKWTGNTPSAWRLRAHRANVDG